MTQRRLHHQGPPQHEWQFTKAENLEHSLQAAQQTGECPHQVTLIKISSGFRVFIAAQLLLLSLAGRDLVNLCLFQGLPEAILGCIPFWLRSLLQDTMF